eukprot:scaffold85461_cov13-Tisochrysis_lutea.AAC.1
MLAVAHGSSWGWALCICIHASSTQSQYCMQRGVRNGLIDGRVVVDVIHQGSRSLCVMDCIDSEKWITGACSQVVVEEVNISLACLRVCACRSNCPRVPQRRCNAKQEPIKNVWKLIGQAPGMNFSVQTRQ